MSSGMEKFPGHAYAPGMEPHVFKAFVNFDLDTAVAGISTPTIVLGVIALALYGVRKLGPRTKLRLKGNFESRQAVQGGRVEAGRVDTLAVLARTMTDRNFARELRQARTKSGDAMKAD